MTRSTTARPITVEIHDTHLYPGALGGVFGLASVERLTIFSPCIVIFADRTVVHGSIRGAAGEEFVLELPTYVTTRGIRIQPKSWLVTVTISDEGPAALRVGRRA